LVNFVKDRIAIANSINTWVATESRHNVNALVQARMLNPDTRCVLVNWRVVHSCSFFQSKNICVAAAGQVDFGSEEFLEGKVFG